MGFSADRALGRPRALACFAALAGPVVLPSLVVLALAILAPPALALSADGSPAALPAGRGGHFLAGAAPPVPFPPSHWQRAPPPGRTPDAAPLAVAVAGLAAAAVALWWRGRRRGGLPAERGLRVKCSPVAAGSVVAPGSAALAGVVAAGSAALAGAGTSREAILACHAAMEEALSASGVWRAADSLEVLLRRAAGERALGAPAALLLAGLFQEARFSSHELGDDDRAAARAALAAIGAEMVESSRGPHGL